MAKRLKTGMVALGLAFLLGCTTPILAKDIKEPEAKAVQEEQEPTLAYPMISKYIACTAKTLQDDNRAIKMKIEYQTLTMFANYPLASSETIILTGKKQEGKIKLEEMWHYSKQPTKIYQKNQINPFVKTLAEKILTENTQESPETDALIYNLFDSLHTETKIT